VRQEKAVTGKTRKRETAAENYSTSTARAGNVGGRLGDLGEKIGRVDNMYSGDVGQGGMTGMVIFISLFPFDGNRRGIFTLDDTQNRSVLNSFTDLDLKFNGFRFLMPA
jgi:hypothetical protein